MPRSRFSSVITKYNVNQKPLTFPLRFGPKQFNATIKKLLKNDNIDTTNVNFNFFIHGQLLTGPLDQFIESKNISQEIEEISYDIEMQPPQLEGEVKTQDMITKISFQSNYVVTASYDVQIFDVNAPEKPVIFIEIEPCMFAADWLSLDESSKEGVIIVGGEHGKISLWRVNLIAQTALKICEFTGSKEHVACFSINNEINLVASGHKDGLLQIWSSDLSDLNGDIKKVPIRLPLVTVRAHSLFILQLQWLSNPIQYPKGSSNIGNLLTCSNDHTIKLWNANHTQCTLIREEDTTNPVKTIDCNNTSGHIVVGSDNNRLKVYDFTSQNAQINNLFQAHRTSIIGVKWMPSNPNNFITAGVLGEMKMWDSKNVTTPLLQVAKLSSYIIAIAISKDGQWLACSTYDKTLRFYKFNV